MTKHDAALFFKAWMAAPLRVASVVPSGPALSRLITSEISAASGHVIELGAGTGVFTKALLDRGVDERDLTLLEFEADFVAALRRKFPRARVLRHDAADLASAQLLTVETVGAVVSGLPILSMPDAKVTAILSGAFDLLREGGSFYQFTYGPVCPVRRSVMKTLKLESSRIGRAVVNFPPAAVYRVSRQADRHALPESLGAQATQ